jgi:hypothetical protein
MDEPNAMRKSGPNPRTPVDAFVTRLQQGRESSELGNINLFPSDLEWLMVASTALKAGNELADRSREQGSQQCACC